MAKNVPERTFIDALYEKYCDDEINLEPIQFPTDNPSSSKRTVEYVGLKKVIDGLKNISNLQVIDLSDQSINADFDIALYNQKISLRKVRSLNLSKNNFPSWTCIAHIIELAPSVEELNLSENSFLKIPTNQDTLYIGNKFENIKILILGKMGQNEYYEKHFKDHILPFFPKIETLSLFNNEISKLDNTEALQNLTHISLSTNLIVDWAHIFKLGFLKKLKTLELPYCKINRIEFPEGNRDEEKIFCSLEYLDLTSNNIDNWDSVAELNKLPKLTTLLLKHNPLHNSYSYHYYFNSVLCRIKNLTKLDREEITLTSRNEAEKYYLSKIYPDYLEHRSDLTSLRKFLKINPYFTEIMAKYGEPNLPRKKTKQEIINDTYKWIRLAGEGLFTDENEKFSFLQIPVTFKVFNLKVMIGSILKLNLSDFNLVIKSFKYEEEMRDRDDVSAYRFDNDTVVHVIIKKKNKG